MHVFDESAPAGHGNGDTAHDQNTSVVLERDPHGMTARVVGELDLLTGSQLTAVLTRIDGNNPGRLLLDLDAVEFVDSSGLAAILLAQRAAEQHGHEFTIRYSSPQIGRLFELTGMTGRFRRE